MQAQTPVRVRRVVASLASLAVAAVFAARYYGEELRPPAWVIWATFLGAPVVATGALWSRRLWAQLLARGMWWSFLLLGTFMCVENGSERAIGAPMAAATAAALLLMGRVGLDTADARFRPVAFRGTLVLALVLAMADVLLFLWTGCIALAGGHGGLVLMLPLMATGIIGLLRLRTWGLLVSLGTNVLVLALTASGVLHVPYGPLRAMILASAAAQLIVPLPMLVTIALRRVPGPDRWRRARAIGATCVIVGLAVVSVSWPALHRLARGD